jgi:hypothetical protein
MLWSQFSAVFAYFGRKNWRFSQKPMLRWFFTKSRSSLSKKRHFFIKNFGENILKIKTSPPVFKMALSVSRTFMGYLCTQSDIYYVVKLCRTTSESVIQQNIGVILTVKIVLYDIWECYTTKHRSDPDSKNCVVQHLKVLYNET